jgi:hypothetical protein
MENAVKKLESKIGGAWGMRADLLQPHRQHARNCGQSEQSSCEQQAPLRVQSSIEHLAVDALRKMR